MTTVVVSPHLDDAVLSVPALVRSRAASGERVVVLTVFSDGDAGFAVRRDEDCAALALLGAEPLHLGLADAPYRRALPRTFRGLVLTELVEGDPDAVAVARVLVDCLAALAPDLLLLPLGVGEHVDHRVVHAAHTHLHGSIGFYEDRPYALVRHAVLARLARLGATVDGEPIAPSRTRAEEYLAASRVAPHVQAYLPQVEREACLRPLAQSLASPAPASGLALRRERLAFDPSALDTAARAVRAYGSQVGDLFGDEEVRTALCGEQPYAETIYWRGYFSPNRAQKSASVAFAASSSVGHSSQKLASGKSFRASTPASSVPSASRLRAAMTPTLIVFRSSAAGSRPFAVQRCIASSCVSMTSMVGSIDTLSMRRVISRASSSMR